MVESLAMARQALQAGEMEVPLRTSNMTPGEVVRWVVKCLYMDEALPRGPLLQWFLQMLVGTKFGHKQLRQFIESASGVYADPPHSKRLNFSALLEEDPPGFVAFLNEEDVAASLTQEVWAEADKCLGRGGWPKADDASHKYYVVASWLQDTSAIFSDMSFGRVLGIVRCSAQKTDLLGHRGGLLVPFTHSEECERRNNAVTGQPTHVAPEEAYVRTWDELRDCLRILVQEQRDGHLEVSQMKSLFRAHFHMELSETVFGHQCLSKLLADPKLGEDFSFDSAHGNRFVLKLKNFAAMSSGAVLENASSGTSAKLSPAMRPVGAPVPAFGTYAIGGNRQTRAI